MTREEQLACLIDRPCNACKFHDKGCFRWKCVFEEEPTDVKPLYKIDTDGHIEEVNKIKEIYRKGWKDGAEATAYHIELCEEENPTIPLSVIEDIKAEIEHVIDETYDSTDYDKSLYNGAYKDGLYDALDIIDKHISGKENG